MTKRSARSYSATIKELLFNDLSVFSIAVPKPVCNYAPPFFMRIIKMPGYKGNIIAGPYIQYFGSPEFGDILQNSFSLFRF